MTQYHTVANIPGVAVAAPLAPVGYVAWNLATLNVSSVMGASGLYRTEQWNTNGGLPSGVAGLRARYVPQGAIYQNVVVWLLVMAVAPGPEARLMGLSQAVTQGHYFTAADERVTHISLPNSVPTYYNLPVLLTTAASAGGVWHDQIQHLAAPPALQASAPHWIAAADTGGRAGPLARLRGPTVFHLSTSYARLWHLALPFMGAAGNAGTGLLGGYSVSFNGLEGTNYVVQTSHAHFAPVHSPFPDRWPVALNVTPVPSMKASWGNLGEPFRSGHETTRPYFALTVVGQYNPARLPVADDPLTHLPLVGYRPASGRLVLNDQGRAVNPAPLVAPGATPAGFWTAPPQAVTTLAAARPVLGPQPISSIRIRVAGTSTLTAVAVARLHQVAQAITRRTGLPVAVVQGASPEQVLIHPGTLAGYARAGWVATDWVRLGASVEILRQALLSQSVVLGPVLAAAALFAGITAWLALEGERRRWAVALALGVAPGAVAVRLLGRAALQGLGVAAVARASATARLVGGPEAWTLGVPVALAAGLVVVGAMAPAVRGVARQDPVTSLRPIRSAWMARMSLTRSARLGVALAAAAWRRLLVAVAALVVPAATAYAIGLVQWAWHNTLHVTVLGQYLLVHGGWLATLALVVCAGLAAIAAAQVALATAVIRQSTWAVGAAVGWPQRVAFGAMAVEAGLVGALAGALGAAGAALIVSPLFGVPVVGWLGGITVVGMTAVSLVAAFPAVWSVWRQDPLRVLKGSAT